MIWLPFVIDPERVPLCSWVVLSPLELLIGSASEKDSVLAQLFCVVKLICLLVSRNGWFEGWTVGVAMSPQTHTFWGGHR
jgi:hypothetical protein